MVCVHTVPARPLILSVPDRWRKVVIRRSLEQYWAVPPGTCPVPRAPEASRACATGASASRSAQADICSGPGMHVASC